MFTITERAISSDEILKSINDKSIGGIVIFEGRVRNNNEGKEVNRLEYEIYPEMAIAEGEEIVRKAKVKFAVNDVICIHRYGILELGEVAVVVVVIAKHRKEAFKACQYVIDTVKSTVPIWKKEYYTDKTTEWVACHGCTAHEIVEQTTEIKKCSHHSHEHDRFKKQILLKEVGSIGQKNLSKKRVAIVGIGGLGCPVVQYLAAMGVSNLMLIDKDVVNLDNIHRQTLYSVSDVGLKKVSVAKQRMQQLYHYDVDTFSQGLDLNNAFELLKDCDLIVDCTDNFATKFLLHDLAFELKIDLVTASIYQWEGQLSTFRFSQRDVSKPCLRCLYPINLQDGCVGTCQDSGVIGVLPGVFGTIQATEAIKCLFNLETLDRGTVLQFDLLTNEMSKIRYSKDPACPLCIRGEPLSYFHTSVLQEPCELVLTNFQEWEQFVVIDLRSTEETFSDHFRLTQVFSRRIPATENQEKFFEQVKNSEKKILLVCSRGFRSKRLAVNLRKNGYEHVYSLNGGLSSLSSVYFSI